MRSLVFGSVALVLGCNAVPGGEGMRKVFKQEAVYEGKPVSHWVEQLHDRSPNTRKQAAIALGKIGPEAESGVPALIDVVKDLATERYAKKNGLVLAEEAEREVHLEIIKALAAIGDGAVPALRSALKSGDGWFRVTMITVLAQMGPKAKPAVPDLITLLQQKGDPTARVLRGPGGVDVERAAAITALATIGPLAEDAVPLLVETLRKDPDLMLRQGAAMSLGKIARKPDLAVPALALALKERDLEMRKIAAESLGNFGPAAKEALPSLREILNDFQVWGIHGEVQAALAKIEGQ